MVRIIEQATTRLPRESNGGIGRSAVERGWRLLPGSRLLLSAVLVAALLRVLGIGSWPVFIDDDVYIQCASLDATRTPLEALRTEIGRAHV